jgi:hypothetical protein
MLSIQDARGKVLGTNSLQRSKDGTNMLPFKPPVLLNADVPSRKAIHFMTVTMPELRRIGAAYFAWIRPGK